MEIEAATRVYFLEIESAENVLVRVRVVKNWDLKSLNRLNEVTGIWKCVATKIK